MIQQRPDVPLCPRCGENDRARYIPSFRVENVPLRPGSLAAELQAYAGAHGKDWWCDRCGNYLAALKPLPGRYVPDF
jgi:hypothetical protein